MLENVSHQVLIISSFELDWMRAQEKGENFLDQSPIKYQYNIKQTSDENKENYQLGDYLLIQYQIL